MSDKPDTDTPLTDALLRDLASLCHSDERTTGLVYKSPIWELARSLERQLAAARKDSERLCEDVYWSVHVSQLRALGVQLRPVWERGQELVCAKRDAAIRRHLTPMEAEQFAQANKETGSTDEV